MEHVEALWGHETVDTFRILRFAPIRLGDPTNGVKKEEAGDPEVDEIYYTRKEAKRQKQLAKEAGMEFLGTVHTHPHIDHEHVPSEMDHIIAVKDGEKMMGIVHLYKPKRSARFQCTVRWWFPQQPLAFEILED